MLLITLIFLVLCSDGDVMLVSTNNLVLLCVNSTWNLIRLDSIDKKIGSVVCSQLGYSPHGITCTLLRNISTSLL